MELERRWTGSACAGSWASCSGAGSPSGSAARALSAVRSFYRYLQVHHGVANTAARAAKVPKLDKRLPTYLDRAQTERLFEWAEARAGGDEFGPTRDLAMLELFYSTGIRLSELSGINLEDLDLLSDQVKVRGKGRKERIVPVGSRAVLALRRYLNLREPVVGRPGGDRRAVFVSRRGQRLAPRGDPADRARDVRRRSAATGSGCTRCATPSPRTCWTPAPTSGRCRSCWATPRSARRRSTPTPASSG